VEIFKGKFLFLLVKIVPKGSIFAEGVHGERKEFIPFNPKNNSKQWGCQINK
jgi:hypothetical protein